MNPVVSATVGHSHGLCLSLCLVAFVVTATTLSTRAADPFAEGVRTTEPLTPEEQQKTFSLPPGFEMQLVATEPDIAKPMNMAFDAKGRLWVTTSLEYPFAAPLDRKGRDSIKIFSDFDAKGRARKVVTFADGLNIPTGILPYKNGAIVWSIPNIWYLEDTDGDGIADKRTILYGPLGYERDTHGMNSSFRRGFDGWLYATHGFNNNSHFKGADGNQFDLNSGNTYRLRVDGSRAEPNTWGQVNPFGLTFDPFGTLFSADCHSSPLYQLLRGGYYPSFGKPHDGLGFAPGMIDHDHGSTAIAGIVFYTDNLWPAAYRENFFIGNVMTSRINRDTLEDHGTTRLAKEMPDFLKTTDPWFRPVDIQLGPDGNMYVADFYNRIIGHYEVPLTHPGRDRGRGRIWRIVYTGNDSAVAKRTRSSAVDQLDTTELITALADPNMIYRMLAMNELVDRVGPKAVAPVRSALNNRKTPDLIKAHGIWVLERLDALEKEGSLIRKLAADPAPLVRVHLLRALGELKSFDKSAHEVALKALTDSHPLVRRTAAETLSLHPDVSNVRPLLALGAATDPKDTHLMYVARKSLRDQFKQAGVLTQFTSGTIAEADSRTIADVCAAVPTSEAASFLLKHINQYQETRPVLVASLTHAARYAPESAAASLATFVQSRFADDLEFQLSLFNAVRQGFQQRGANLPAEINSWGARLADGLLKSALPAASAWFTLPVDSNPGSASPWFLQKRPSSDGDKSATFFCSLPPGGEALTGRLRSRLFGVPPTISFYLAGHDGYPDKPAKKKNLIALRDASTDEVLAQAYPPRNDTAQLVKWELRNVAGRQAYLEIVDADTGDAYAWLAVGRFEPAIAPFPSMDPRKQSTLLKAGADLARTLNLRDLRPALATLTTDSSADLVARAAAAETLATFAGDPLFTAAATLISESSAPTALRNAAAAMIAHGRRDELPNFFPEAFRSLPARLQSKLAQTLAGSPAGATLLVTLCEKGIAAAALLRERNVSDKLQSSIGQSARETIARLTKGLSPVNEAKQKAMDARRVAFDKTQRNAAHGAEIFAKNCTPCHRIGNNGNLVGPQLDGIGSRGLERLVEDILDPNRNVDSAFRTTIYSMKDGDVISGLFRRQEGELTIVAESTGKELSIKTADVQSRRESETSLMPENFEDVIAETDFHDLLAFLLASRSDKR